ncbi:MAG: endonuclease III domain-containing protein [Acidobacteriaceae bacterium]
MVEAYGPQQWWPAETALEVVVGAYLTQSTSWRSVERSIENLRTHKLLTVDALHQLAEEELRVHIRPSGYMVRKAAAIKAFVRFLADEYGGSLERLSAVPTGALREQLLALPGVGQETADAILLYALGHSVMVVDEYLRRITIRHGLAPTNASYGELQRLACGAFRGEDAAAQLPHFNEFHALIVMVGKQHCGPSPHCAGCPLAGVLAPIDGTSASDGGLSGSPDDAHLR